MDDWHSLKGLLQEALSLPEGARAPFVAEVLARDQSLGKQLESLLAVGDETKGKLEAQTLRTEPKTGQQLGSFSIERHLGSGGMGAVYLARQERPHPRQVALKIINHLFPDAAGQARFEREQAILARLNHDHIARLYESGTTREGQPFFVMEYVPGTPITHFAREHQLTLDQRLLLLGQVCAAVAHAHVNGIIHRDLKPSNILVREQDGLFQAKVIDFGVARAIDATLESVGAKEPGTPRYMSPEQWGLMDHHGDRITPDYRSDVYSLGVILYELVVGGLPHDVPEQSSWAALAHSLSQGRVIPAQRRFKLFSPEQRRRIAEERQCSEQVLRRHLKGDLGKVTAVALANSPDDRYATPKALAIDLENVRSKRPVSASSPDLLYVLGRFFARHRLATSFSLLALLVLQGFFVFTVRQNTQIRAERNRAEAQTRKAEKEAQTARRVSDFLISLFEGADPEGRAKNLSTTQLLERGLQEIERSLQDEPQVKARLLATLAQVHLGLRQGQKAHDLVLQAMALQDRYSDDQMRVTLAVIHGVSLYELGQLEAGQSRLQWAVDFCREKQLPQDLLAESLNGLGLVSRQRGHYAQAEACYREALTHRKAHFGDRHLLVAESLSNLAALLRLRHRLDEAEPLYLEGLNLRRTLLGGEHPLVAYSLNGLSLLYFETGQFEKAEPLLKEALTIRRKALGGDHPLVATTLNNLGGFYFTRQDYQQAEPFFMEAFVRRYRLFGPNHYQTAVVARNLARNNQSMGALETAEGLFLLADAWMQAGLPADHPAQIGNARYLGKLMRQQGRFEEAQVYFERILTLERAKKPRDPQKLAEISALLALCHGARGDYRGALARIDQPLDVLMHSFPELWLEACSAMEQWSTRANNQKN